MKRELKKLCQYDEIIKRDIIVKKDEKLKKKVLINKII